MFRDITTWSPLALPRMLALRYDTVPSWDAAWNDWYTLADSALYEAKRQGGNVLCIQETLALDQPHASGHR